MTKADPRHGESGKRLMRRRHVLVDDLPILDLQEALVGDSPLLPFHRDSGHVIAACRQMPLGRSPLLATNVVVDPLTRTRARSRLTEPTRVVPSMNT